MNKDILFEVIEKFVLKERRPRFREFICSPGGWDGRPKRYDDFLHELLNDPRNFSPGCVVEDLHGGFEASNIAIKLRKMGAGKIAYLVSEDWDVDGKTGSLEEILSLVTGAGEFVYCIGTELGYYEGHENWHYILKSAL